MKSIRFQSSIERFWWTLQNQLRSGKERTRCPVSGLGFQIQTSRCYSIGSCSRRMQDSSAPLGHRRDLTCLVHLWKFQMSISRFLILLYGSPDVSKRIRKTTVSYRTAPPSTCRWLSRSFVGGGLIRLSTSLICHGNLLSCLNHSCFYCLI